jgi:hypothetical protein
MKQQFNHIGYTKDYFVGDKYVGSMRCEHSGPTGYDSRRDQTAKENIKVGKKTIKAGTDFWTIVIPLSGRIIQS